GVAVVGREWRACAAVASAASLVAVADVAVVAGLRVERAAGARFDGSPAAVRGEAFVGRAVAVVVDAVAVVVRAARRQGRASVGGVPVLAGDGAGGVASAHAAHGGLWLVVFVD